MGGAGRLAAMIGAHSFVGSDQDQSLTFKFKARAANGSNCVRVTLDASDTYTVEFLSVRGYKVAEKGSTSFVYADSLRRVIESATGLALSL